MDSIEQAIASFRDGFPCPMLQPAADGADRWAEEEAATNRNRYYRGKFVVGAGPVLE